MASLSEILITGRSAVLTHQERLAVTSHNIANADTAGFHRQRVSLTTNPPTVPTKYTTRKYVEGTGVRVADVIRVYNRMKETALLERTSSYEGHQTLADALGEMEGLLGAGHDGSLDSLMRSFSTAWSEVSSTPDGLAERSVLLQRATALAEHFNLLSTRLTAYRTGIADGGVGPDFTGTVPAIVDEVNDLASRIQDLNVQITMCRGQGISANDLQDQRDRLLTELSERVAFTLEPNDDVTVDGQLLVSGNGQVRNELTLVNADSDPLEFSLDGAAVSMGGGSLGGWTTAASQAEYLLARLDTLAGTLITEVNAVHVSGYDLDGNLGLDFFTGTGAADIAVAVLDPRLVAAANTLHDPGPPPIPNVADGGNALEIAALFSQDFPGLENLTFNGYHGHTMVGLGAYIQSTENAADDGLAVVNMLKDSIQSESGVSLDDELVDMMAAQRAYQAAVRLVNAADGLLDVVINRMGA